MEYITYKRFKGRGIGGVFNLPYGTIVTERKAFLFAKDGRCICAATSENGWNHFHPNTEQAKRRQQMLEKLYRFYEAKENQGVFFEDVDISAFPPDVNTYWKNILRTMDDVGLQNLYLRRCGECSK